MRLLEVPTAGGPVWVNPDRVLSVSTWTGRGGPCGTEIRFEGGGFGGSVVYTSLSPFTVVKLLRGET